MQQWSAQHLAFIVEMFFRNGDSVVKRGEYFAIISILLVREKFITAIPYNYGKKLSAGVLPHEKKKPPGSMRAVR
jgi:hypothetical protein